MFVKSRNFLNIAHSHICLNFFVKNKLLIYTPKCILYHSYNFSKRAIDVRKV